MRNFDKTDCFFGGMFIGVLLLWAAFEVFDNTATRFEQEAISRGFGEYLVDTNKNVTFQWKK